MIIKSLKTTGFGKFSGNHEWDDFSPGLNVFYGKNEAGKTTIFNMILHLIFGSQSKKKQVNFFTNEESQHMNVSGVIEEQGVALNIYRNFLDKDALNDTSLSYASHIPRKTYKDIYALTLEDLTTFKSNTWADIQELLLSQYNSDTFCTPKEVLEKIEKDMRDIKKPTERGNSILKSLENQRKESFLKKKEIQNNLLQAEKLEDQWRILEKEIESLKSKKINILHQKDQVRTLMPILKNIYEKENLASKMIALDNFDLHVYESSKEKLKKLYLQMDEVSEHVSNLLLEKRRLLTLIETEDISELTFNEMFQKHIMLGESAQNLQDMENELHQLEVMYKKSYDQTFEDGFTFNQLKKINGLNYLNLKSLIQEVESVNDEIKSLKRDLRKSKDQKSKAVMVLMVILILLSGGAFYRYDDAIIQYASIFIIGLSFMQFLFQVTKRKNAYKPLDFLMEEKDALRLRLKKELQGLSISSIVEEFMGQEFLSQVLELKNMGERYVQLDESYQIKVDHYDSEKSAIEAYLKTHIGLSDDSDEPFAILKEKLEKTKSANRKIEVINGQVDILNDQLKSLEKELNTLELYVETGDQFLKKHGEGNISEGIEFVNLQMKYQNQYNSLCDQINQSQYNPDLLLSFRNSYESSDDQSYFDINHLEVDLSAIEDTLNEKIVSYVKVKKDWQLLISNNDIDEILGVLSHIDDEIKKYKRKYDRYQIMYNLVKNSDIKFRRENQPEVFKNAGDFLKAMTRGKYTGLEVLQDSQKSEQYMIRVHGPKGQVVVDKRLSKGTLNQIYLALRLSLIDHLDQGHTRLPICFDELLIEWDAERLKETIILLKRLSEKRQVFIFTCHEWFLDALKKECPVKTYKL